MKMNSLKATHFGADFLLLASIMMLCPSYSTAQEYREVRIYNGDEYFSIDSPIIRDKEALFSRWIRQASTDTENIRTATSPKIVQWRDSVTGFEHALKSHPRATLEKINTVTNMLVPYKTDREIYGQSDYWSSPVKTLLNGGDCEDIAMLNATALVLNGWPPDKMKILVGYVNYQGKRMPHAVLQVETNEGRLILNNLRNDVRPFAESGIETVYMIDERGAIIFSKRAAR